jgi:DNA-binding NtrC family response regulator
MARILIVESDRFFAQALAGTLGLAGHEVSVAEGAVEGLHRGSLEPPDVVIAAWRLGSVMHGGEVCRQIHAVWPSAKPMVTPPHQEHVLEAAQFCRCIEPVLVKPFHKNDITEAVRRALADTTAPAPTCMPLSSFSEQADSCLVLTQG